MTEAIPLLHLRRQKVIVCALGVVWIFSTFWASHYAWTRSPDLPLNDAAVWVRQAVGSHPVSARWLWAQHNEHRLPLVKLAYVGAVRATGDFRSPAVLSVLLMSGASLVLLASVRRRRGQWAWWDLCIPVALLGFAQHATLRVPFQIAFAISTLMIGLLTYLAVTSTDRPGSARLWGILGVVLLGIASTSVGMIVAAPVLAWVTWEAWRTMQASPRHAAALLAGVSAIIAVQIAYMQGLRRPGVASEPFNATGWAQGVVDLLSTATLTGVRHSGFAALIGGTTLVLIGLAWTVCARRGADRSRRSSDVGVLAVLTGGVGLVLLIAFGRAGWPVGTLLEPRYALLTSTILMTGYVASVAITRPGRMVTALISGMVLIACPFNYSVAQEQGGQSVRFESDIRAFASTRVPVEAVAQRFWGSLPTREPVMLNVLRETARHGIGPYAGVSAPVSTSQLIEVDLSTSPDRVHDLRRDGETWRGTGNDPQMVWRLPGAMNLAGVRVRYSVARVDGMTAFPMTRQIGDPDAGYLQPPRLDPTRTTTPVMYWTNDGEFDPARSVVLRNQPLPVDARDVTFWFTARATSIRFDPDVRNVNCMIERVTAVVVPDELTPVFRLDARGEGQ